jgi:trehalose utilization protein
MIFSLQGNDIFTEFKQELKKYNNAHPNNPSPIQVVGWFEGTGIARSGSTLFETAAQAKYNKSGAQNYTAVLNKKLMR